MSQKKENQMWLVLLHLLSSSWSLGCCEEYGGQTLKHHKGQGNEEIIQSHSSPFWGWFFDPFLRSGSVARFNDPNWKICSFICIGFPPQTCVFICVHTHMPTHCAIVAHVRTEAWGRIHEHWNEHGKGLPGFWVSLGRWEELNWVGSVLFLLGKTWLPAQIPGFSVSKLGSCSWIRILKR